MPRRKSGPATEEAGERRVTRGSVQKTPEKEAAAKGRTRPVPDKPPKTSPSPNKSQGRGKPSTPKSGRSRGRGRGRGQGKKAEAKQEESEDEGNDEAEELNEDIEESTETAKEEVVASPKKAQTTPKKGASPRGRGRGRGKGQSRGRSRGGWSKPVDDEDGDGDNDDNVAVESKEDDSVEKPQDTSQRRRSSRSPRVSSTESTPRRRSGRTPVKIQNEPDQDEDMEDATEDNQEKEVDESEDPEHETSESRGKKRKLEDQDESPSISEPPEENAVKKQKIDEEQDEKEDTASSSVDQAEDMDTSEASNNKVDAEKSIDTEKVEEKQEAIQESEEKTGEPTKVESPKVNDVDSENPIENDVSMENDCTTKEDSDPEPSPDVSQESKSDSQIKNSETAAAADMEHPTPSEQDKTETTTQSEEDETIISQVSDVDSKTCDETVAPVDDSYVMVSLSDVPPATSSEVAASIPKEPQEAVASTEDEETTAIEINRPEISQDSSVSSTVDNNKLVDVNGGDCTEAKPPTLTTSVSGSSVHNMISAAPSLNMNNGPSVDLMAENGHALNPLYNRKFITNKSLDDTTVNPTHKFSIVSYNILAECHMPEGRYPWLTDEHIANRHSRLLAELRHLNGDILCLQEVSPKHYTEELQPDLKKLGYDGIFVKRFGDQFDEGEATFFRTDRFTLSNHRTLRLTDVAKKDIEASNLDSGVHEALVACLDSFAVCALVNLQCKQTSKTLCVGNIHVAWDRFERQDLQCVQVASAIKELVNLAGGADKPHVICGDFNAWMGTPVYQLTQEGYLNDESMATLQAINAVHLPDGSNASTVNHWWKGFQHTSNNLKSSYATILGTEPKTSQFPHDRVLRGVDIIWYASGSLDLLGVLQTAPESDLEKGVPNATYPSDHVSIQSYLSFK